jgi:hypothetical protein
MTCEEARKELSVNPLESAGQSIQAHVAGCESCQSWLANLQALETRLQTWRAEAPPPGLQTRIAAAIETTDRSSRKNYFSLWKENPTMRRRSFAAALAVFAICAAYFSVLTSKPASAYDRMLLALHHVKSAHMVIWYNTAKTGPVHIEKVEEAWYQDHRWRTNYGDGRPGGIIRDRTFYKYDEKQHKVVTGVVTGPPVTDFSLATIAGDYMPTGAHPHAELLGTTSENGKSVQEISLDLSNQGERMLFWVDSATGLPMRAEKQDLDYHTKQWIVNGRFEFEFNQDLPASLFDPQTLAPNP